MSPSDANSSLAALRQLKEMLDAGTITPQEFEALKRQLIFGVEPALPIAPPALAADNFSASPPEALAPVPETTLAAYQTEAPNPAELPPPPAATPDWLASAAPSLLASGQRPQAPTEERRNPLNLVFIVGGLLIVLGIVLYLFIERPSAPDEHLTSASQTAADSTTVAPEVGPQAEQITLPPAAPETVRVAPVTRPVAAPAASQFQADSAAAPAAPASAPASKAPATPPPASSAPNTDSTTRTP